MCVTKKKKCLNPPYGIMLWSLAVLLLSSVSCGIEFISETQSRDSSSLMHGIEGLSDSPSTRYTVPTEEDASRNARTSSGGLREKQPHSNLAGLWLGKLASSSPFTALQGRRRLQLRPEWDPNMEITSLQDAQTFVANFDPKILLKSIEKTLNININLQLYDSLLTIGLAIRKTRVSMRYKTWLKLLAPTTSHMAVANEILKLFPVWSQSDLETSRSDELIENSFKKVMSIEVKEHHEGTDEINCNNDEEIKQFLKKLLIWQIERVEITSEQTVKSKNSRATLFLHNEDFELFDFVLRRGLDGPKFFRVDAGHIDKLVRHLYPFPGTFGVEEDRDRDIEIRVNKVFDTYLKKRSFLLREPVLKKLNIEPREEWVVRTDLACVHDVVRRIGNDPNEEVAGTVAYFHQRVIEMYADRSLPIRYLTKAYTMSAPPQFHSCPQDKLDFRPSTNSLSITRKHLPSKHNRGILRALGLKGMKIPNHVKLLRKVTRFLTARKYHQKDIEMRKRNRNYQKLNFWKMLRSNSGH